MKTKNILIFIITVSLLVSCNSDDNTKTSTPSLEEQLIGRWEAIEYSWVNSDGIREYSTFGPDGDFEVEYSIGIDYSSGFELMEDNLLDLIWYGENKEQFFSWNIENNNLIIDNGTLTFTVISVSESILNIEFDNGNKTYKMKRLE